MEGKIDCKRGKESEKKMKTNRGNVAGLNRVYVRVHQHGAAKK